MSNTADPQYVLGTGNDELERLGLQHRLWSDATHALWRRARIAPGQRVLDVGCGPGYAAFDLAQLVQRHGSVIAVDESKGFVRYLADQARSRELTQLAGRTGDVQDLDTALADEREFDIAYARWVLCFVARPEAVVSGVARALKPGGRFVVQDYFNYEAMTISTKSPAHAKVVSATARSWRKFGGDPDIVGRLPRMMREHGIDVVSIEQHQRVARPGESMWHWTESWWRSFVPKLIAMGELTQADAEQFFAATSALDPATDFALLPTVFEVVGVKR